MDKDQDLYLLLYNKYYCLKQTLASTFFKFSIWKKAAATILLCIQMTVSVGLIMVKFTLEMAKLSAFCSCWSLTSFPITILHFTVLPGLHSYQICRWHWNRRNG